MPLHSDHVLVDRIRAGEASAWEELIARYEGRLLAYVQGRLRDRSAGEDVVQETLVGFLTSLPNYDPTRSLEGYLFSIAAHKLTDALRRAGRRPAIPFSAANESSAAWEPIGPARPASSLLRGGERRELETGAIAAALADQIAHLRGRGDWLKLECLELLFVRGWSNKRTAEALAIGEQQVANFKFDFLARLRSRIEKRGLSPDVFPELAE